MDTSGANPNHSAVYFHAPWHSHSIYFKWSVTQNSPKSEKFWCWGFRTPLSVHGVQNSENCDVWVRVGQNPDSESFATRRPSFTNLFLFLILSRHPVLSGTTHLTSKTHIYQLHLYTSHKMPKAWTWAPTRLSALSIVYQDSQGCGKVWATLLKHADAD